MDEELLVRLTGEASDYIKMLNDAQSKTESVGSTISTALDETSSQSISSLESVAQTVNEYADQIEVAADGIDELSDAQEDASDNASTLADKLDSAAEALGDIGSAANDVAEAISKVTGGLEFWDSFEAFAEAEASEIKLRTALEANGREVETLIGDYKDFADEIQRVSTTEGDLAIALLQQAESLGVTGEAAKRAVKSAVAMQNAFGVAAESAIRMTTELENGKTTMLARYIPALRGIKDGAEAAALAQEYLAKAHKVTEANAQTAAGQIEQLNNAWGDFKEEVGGVIAQVLKPLVSTLKEVVSFFQELPQPVKIAIAGLLTLVTVIGAVSAVSATVIVAVKGVVGVLSVYVTWTKLATIATIAWKTALIGGLAYAAYEGIRALMGVQSTIDNLNQSMEESQRLNDKWADRFSKNTTDILEDIEKLSSPGEKQSAITKQLETAQKELQGYKNLVESSTKQFDELNTRWNRWTATSAVEATNKELEDHKRKLEMARTRVEQLNNAYNKLTQLKLDEALKSDIEKFNEQLRIQGDTIGMTSEEIQIYKFTLRGAKDEMLNATRAQIEMNNVFKGFATLLDRSTDFTKNLADSIRFNGMEQGTVNVIKMREELTKLVNERQKLRETVTKSEEETRTLVKQLDLNAKKAFQIQEQIDKSEELIKTQKRLLEFDKMMDQGHGITKQVRKPLEVYKDTVTELTKLLDNSAITQETFNRAIDDARKKLDDTTKAANKTKESLTMLNAVEFGSNEALDRIDEFNDKIRQQMESVRQAAEQQKKLDAMTFRELPQETRELLESFDIGKRFGEGIKQGIGDTFNNIEELRKKVFPTESDLRQEMFQNLYRQLNPVSTGMSTPSNVTAGSSADNTVMTDRKEMVKFLSSIDGTLKNISGKPGVTLGTVNIQNT